MTRVFAGERTWLTPVLRHRFAGIDDRADQHGIVLIHELSRGADTVDVQALRVFIRQLRQKIEANPEQPRHILTELGVSYRLLASE